MKSMQRELPDLLQRCDRLLESLQNRRSYTILDVFRNSSIIGMTTNGAAKYRDLLRKVGPKVVVCEEPARNEVSARQEPIRAAGDGDRERRAAHVDAGDAEANASQDCRVNLYPKLIEHLRLIPLDRGAAS
ncbi:hypothetical protein BC938DRAFT_479393 [Jimgerdemannia flammicorona]|uniref:Uncharacterized protein n=1 Tax=Jimgerdemannia flammicorona TaxID=994334 RepID=A0A433QKZ1_9FUNG|nr:hypothetical protein BC938DRAFT_479393 [Jimgerdemannia flammicorona]